MPATSSKYCVDLDGKPNWDLEELKATDKPLPHTVLMTKITELQEICRLAGVAGFSFMVDVPSFALGRMSDFVAGDVFLNDSFWRSGEVLELLMKYDASWCS